MPRKPTPEPREVERVREIADELADLLDKVEKKRKERNRAMLAAKRAGATGDHLAAATGLTRRNVHRALADPEGTDT